MNLDEVLSLVMCPSLRMVQMRLAKPAVLRQSGYNAFITAQWIKEATYKKFQSRIVKCDAPISLILWFYVLILPSRVMPSSLLSRLESVNQMTRVSTRRSSMSPTSYLQMRSISPFAMVMQFAGKGRGQHLVTVHFKLYEGKCNIWRPEVVLAGWAN